MKNSIVIPKEISGFKEWMPEERIVEQSFIDIIKREYESFGFIPIETAAVERNEILESKGVASKEIYRLTRLAPAVDEKNRDRDYSLHFDLTVPFARYVAQNYSKLIFPFKRYQIQKVWRGERPGEGRFREFYQCDIDVIGDGELSLMFDVEILAIIARIFKKLDIGRFFIRVNNRKLLRGLFKELGLPTQARIDRIYQKTLLITSSDGTFNPYKKALSELTDLLYLDKEGRQAKQILDWIQNKPEKVAKENIYKFEEGRIIKFLDAVDKVSMDELYSDLVQKMEIPSEIAYRLLAFIERVSKFNSNAEAFQYLKTFSDNEDFRKGISELEQLCQGAASIGITENVIKIDPTIARGLDYYTGVVYETMLQDHPEVGSVCSGGRYENLASHFSTKLLPGVGISIGLTRLLHVCFKYNLVNRPKPTLAKLLLVSTEEGVPNELLGLANRLRDRGLPCEVYWQDKSLKAKLKFADKKGFKFVILHNNEDYKSGIIGLRNMLSGEQMKVSYPRLLEQVLWGNNSPPLGAIDASNKVIDTPLLAAR